MELLNPRRMKSVSKSIEEKILFDDIHILIVDRLL